MHKTALKLFIDSIVETIVFIVVYVLHDINFQQSFDVAKRTLIHHS